MNEPISVRRLGPDDIDLLTHLARDDARYEDAGVVSTAVPLSAADATRFLSDDHTHLLVAFDVGDDPLGFVVVNELLHRHTFTSMFLVYEIGVAADRRREGIGRALLDAVRALAVERGVPEGFVLTNESNTAAMGLYAAAGGSRPSLDVAEWDFTF